MVLHVVQWLLHGTTLSPVEPSEAMELGRRDVINTGFVFFAAALASTAVFGRFFCGWGCHLIALQDLSRWLLIRVGIRPRPLRSRLLGLAPLAAALYMFCWPAAYRLVTGRPFGRVTARFLTDDFWATFPGLVVAAVTFAVCGFVVVLVLGAKGYCAYGCPYGAFFGLADRLAPVRVRVTDACRGCATCTSVCTSNVRVHEEVRDRGMVVDPGCMKCLDCVASCPNDALFVGTGPRPARSRGGRRRPGSLRWPEEVLAAVVFVIGVAVFRGLYDAVPFLLALGIAAALAGLAVIAVRLVRRSDAWLGPIRLKADGRLRRSGRIAAAGLAVATLGVVHSASVRVSDVLADSRYRAATELRRSALDLELDLDGMARSEADRIRAARKALELAERVNPLGTPSRDLQLAWMLFLEGDRLGAQRRLTAALRHDPSTAEAHLLAARMLVADGRIDTALEAYARASELDPGDPAAFLSRGSLLAGQGRLSAAAAVFSAGLEAVPDSVDLRYNLGLTRALAGDLAAAIDDFEAVLTARPGHDRALENLAGTLAAAGRFDDAVDRFEEAVRRSPDDPGLRLLAARACVGAGRRSRAEVHIDAAVELDPSLESARRILD
jgi:tetratricopeptide (TPR) repeat protein/ferredoxin